jgi:integrase
LVAPKDRALLAATLRMGMESRSASTLAVYDPKIAHFKDWCTRHGYSSLPAQPVHVAMYLTELVASGSSYPPVKAASAAIFTMHQVAGCPQEPTKHVLCKNVRAAAKRRFGVAVRNRKEPLSVATCAAIVTKLTGGSYSSCPLWALMLSAYVMLCFAGFFRYDDATRIKRKDVKFYAAHAEIFLAKRKNDPFRKGNVIPVARGSTGACPVRLLEALFARVPYGNEQHIFQAYDGHAAGRGGDPPLAGAQIEYGRARYQVMKQVGLQMGLSVREAQARFGLHSLRSGGATKAAAENVDERVFQAHGGWKSREAMLAYIEETLDHQLSVTRAMGY